MARLRQFGPAVVVLVVALGCTPTSTATRPGGVASPAADDCAALSRLLTAARGVPSLRSAVGSGAPGTEVLNAAEAVLSPIKEVYGAYTASGRADPQANAIRAAVEDLAGAAAFFEGQQAPGASAPPSGLGSVSWALGQLEQGVVDVKAAAALLRTEPAPNQAICPAGGSP